MSSSPPSDPWSSESTTPYEGIYEPDPDDEDTGPLEVSTPSASFDSDRDSGPAEGVWAGRFDTPLTVSPRQVRRERKPIVLLSAAALVVVVVVAGLTVWLLRRSPATPESPSADTTSSTSVGPAPNAEDEARLLGLLPAGYTSDACKPVAPPEDALAQVSCAKNSDPGGPQSASYTLVSDKAALDAAFDDVVQTSTRVNCPGNIQSPGPWRRNATPQKTSGVLFCGTQDSRPTVAWTDDAELLVSSVQSGPQGPTFDQLYVWWSSHS